MEGVREGGGEEKMFTEKVAGETARLLAREHGRYRSSLPVLLPQANVKIPLAVSCN